jgi:glutamate synthase (NADPH/NADH) small chain
MEPIAGSEFELPAEVVLVAFGFGPPILPQAGGFDQLAADEQGVLKVDESQMTNLPGVFAGGSAVYGYGHLVKAVREARTAALAIDSHVHESKQ